MKKEMCVRGNNCCALDALLMGRPPPLHVLQMKGWSVPKAIVLSWLIAFGEYCLQVRVANCSAFHATPHNALHDVA